MSIATRSTSVQLTLLANRLSIGIYFVIAGHGKIFESGIDAWMKSYGELTPPWLPRWFAEPYGYTLPFVEVLVGLALMLGLYGRTTALIMAMMIASFIMGATGISHDRLPFEPNVILLTLLLLLAATGPGRISMDTTWRKKR